MYKPVRISMFSQHGDRDSITIHRNGYTSKHYNKPRDIRRLLAVLNSGSYTMQIKEAEWGASKGFFYVTFTKKEGINE